MLMNRTLVAVVIALLFIPMLPPNAQAQSVLGTNAVLQDTNEVHGLYGSQVILRNSTHMELFELTNNSVLGANEQILSKADAEQSDKKIESRLNNGFVHEEK